MKITRVWLHQKVDGFFMKRLWRGGAHWCYFADNAEATGVGSTPQQAIRDLRASYVMVKKEKW